MGALKIVLYFSIFKYPLTLEEIFSFSEAEDIDQIEAEIIQLLERKIVFKFGEFYTSVDDENLVNYRLKGNEMADLIMPKAYRNAKLIMKFPFVKSVCISGSLSKNYYDAKSDIDFFIITAPYYLWLSRTLLILYKKLILLNSKQHFCVNYFISTEQLEIKEQNRFTATELVTLMPIHGASIFKKFIEENSWYKSFYPNRLFNHKHVKEDLKKPFLSKFIESIFRNKLGRFLNSKLKQLTLNVWKSKFKHLKNKEFDVAMKSTNDVSKHHPQDFQSKVMVKLNEKYIEHNKTHNLNLVLEHA